MVCGLLTYEACSGPKSKSGSVIHCCLIVCEDLHRPPTATLDDDRPQQPCRDNLNKKREQKVNIDGKNVKSVVFMCTCCTAIDVFSIFDMKYST